MNEAIDGSQSVEVLGLSPRALNALTSRGVLTVEELCRLPVGDLLKIKNLGKATAAEIEAALTVHGLRLSGQPSYTLPFFQVVTKIIAIAKRGRPSERAWYAARLRSLSEAIERDSAPEWLLERVKAKEAR